VQNAGTALPPDNHQVWWTEEFPCFASGRPIEQISNENNQVTLFSGCTVRYRFSNKPEGLTAFADHYSKLVHYVNLLQNQARAIDPSIDARTFRPPPAASASPSPFRYEDSASARAEIQRTSARLAQSRVAVVGLGGTGSYVLDQLAKTPVSEIHLFDGDLFLQHNAFRSPGAATLEELTQQPPKTEYFQRKYSAMHAGIVSHPYNLAEANVNELEGFDFAFVCVDQGRARKLLFDYLMSRGIPMIDVGMNLQAVSENSKLVGSCRYTLCTREQHDHFATYAPTAEDDQDVLYRQNVQIADMNALNALLAVMRWKQHLGFYQDDFGVHNATFSVNSMSLARDVLRRKSDL
jgi:hypothetical protein